MEPHRPRILRRLGARATANYNNTLSMRAAASGGGGTALNGGRGGRRDSGNGNGNGDGLPSVCQVPTAPEIRPAAHHSLT